MPKYEINVSRTVTHTATLHIDAEDEDKATSKAIDLAAHGVDAADKRIEWDFEDEEFDIESCDDLDDYEDEDDSDK